MLNLLRKHRTFFTVFLLAAVALRIFFIVKVELYDGDTFVYGEFAKNLVLHGTLGWTTQTGASPSYIRLPGYPGFLAAIWSFTGVEHYTAIEIVQLFFDLGTCFLIADLTRRVASDRAAKIAFALAVLCPFTAIYVAQPVTECLAIFFAALALDLAVAGANELSSGRIRYWIACGLAVGAGILMRPDGGIMLGAIGIYLLLRLFAPTKMLGTSAADHWKVRRNIVVAGIVLACIALSPLVPWTMRNWRVYHRFEPLAPRYANEPEESYNEGFQRWIKTWMVDYSNVVNVYWHLPGQTVDPHVLPSRAFDSEQERQQTSALFAEYNKTFEWTPAMDAELGRIADARIHRNPLRYYVTLPALRIGDMWFRPKTDLMDLDDQWWKYDEDRNCFWWSVAIGALNLLLVGTAVFALFGKRELRYVGLLLVFVVVRSAFLSSIENPETRYTLECYPVVLALAAVALAGRRSAKASTSEGTFNAARQESLAKI